MPASLNNRWMGIGLLAVALLLGANLMTRAGTADSKIAGRVEGGLPDQGAQLLAVVEELKAANQKLASIEKLLASGELTVKTKTTEKDSK